VKNIHTKSRKTPKIKAKTRIRNNLATVSDSISYKDNKEKVLNWTSKGR